MLFCYRLIRLVSCSLAGLAVLLISSQCLAGSAAGIVKMDETLQSASELSYPPFSVIRPDGTADGFSVQLLTAVAKAVGLEVKFKVGPWHEIKQELIRGNLDVLPLVSYSEERDQDLDFSAPYLRMHGTIFVRKGETDIKSEADLKGKEVLVMKGDTAHEYALRNRLTDKLVLTDSFEEAMSRLSRGENDALLIQQLVGYQILQKLKLTNLVDLGSLKPESLKPQAIPLSGFEQKFCIAVPKGHRDLLNLLNEGLTIVIANGTYQALYQKWFSPILPAPQASMGQILKILSGILVPVLIIGAILMMRLLKRQVKKKTIALSLANKKIQESEQRLRTALEFANDGLFDWDLITNEIYYSPVWKRLLGYGDDELPNEFSVWEKLTDPGDVRDALAMKQEVVNGQRDRFEIELKMRHKDGHWMNILSRANAIFDEKGNAVRFVGTHLDISERKRSEAALRENEQRYKRAQRMGRVGNWEYDLFNQTFWGSDQAKRIYGFEPDSPRFTTEEVEGCIPERERVHQALIDLIEKNIPYDLEFVIHPVSGPKTRTIRSVAEIIRDDSGAPMKVAGVVQDITEQKNAQEEKQSLERALNQAQKLESIGRLAGGVAHDFNNMLSIILGNSEMLLEDLPPSGRTVKKLNEIHRAATRSADLTRQLLAFARKQTISPKNLDLNVAIEGMLKMLKRLIGEDLDLVWNPGDDIWTIKIDPTQVDQILANFCVNSRDAIRDIGKVTIETCNVSFDQAYCRIHKEFLPGDYVMLAFSDDGQGMDAMTLDKIFDPFFTTKKTGEGTGLGLATIYGIVKQNNGFIHVYSEPDQGTVFKVYFSRSRCAGKNEQEARSLVVKGDETILLVEDDEAILGVISKMLERLGYKVLSTPQPSQAVKLAASAQPGGIHLLMTDVVMPQMNGRELADTIRKIDPEVDILYMSGYTANVIAHRGILEEGLNFINKPFSKETLSLKLRQILDGKT